MTLKRIVPMLCAVVCLWVTALDAQTRPPARGTPGTTGTDETRDRLPAQSGRNIEVARNGGLPEVILVGAPADVAAADAALVDAGAQLLRIRSLPGLDRALRVYVLRRLSLPQARALVAQAAGPAPQLDFNAIYRFAQGGAPRLYAAALVGDSPGCRLPGSRVVGMIDGPVATGHPALLGARVTQLSALLDGDSPVSAEHGTAVAGLIAGTGGGITGFAPGVHVIAVTAFAQERGAPGADVDRIAGALDALARADADVINMSFAGPQNSVMADLLGATAARGSLLVAAAGNTGAEAALYPAAARDVIAVTAVDAALRPYRQATRGAHIDVAAPGVDLFVAGPGGGRYASGTSYASPIVAAMAARLHGRGVRSAEALRAQLQSLSRDLGTPGRDRETGWGLISAPGC